MDTVVYYYNHIMEDSATGKYYEHYNEWMELCIKNFARLITCTDVAEENVKEKYIEKIALRYCEWMCIHYMEFCNANRDIADRKLKDSIEKAKNYISHNSIADTTLSPIQSEIREIIINNKSDYNKLYSIIYDYLNYPFKRLRAWIKKPIQHLKMVLYFHSAIW